MGRPEKPTREDRRTLDEQRRAIDGKGDEIRSQVPTDAYREGWERIFGKAPPPVHPDNAFLERVNELVNEPPFKCDNPYHASGGCEGREGECYQALDTISGRYLNYRLQDCPSCGLHWFKCKCGEA